MSESVKTSKYNEKDIKKIMAQLYVARNITIYPAKVIKFVMENREIFPDFNDEIIEKLMLENKVSQDDIDKEKSVNILKL